MHNKLSISKILKGILLIPFVLIMLIILLFIISPMVNNMSAASIEKRLSALPVPQSCELRESFSAAGKLSGNGNGMQFLGAILIETELSHEELKAHYAQYSDEGFNCIVNIQTGSKLAMIEHGTRDAFLDWQAPEPPKQAYIVYAWGSGNAFFREFDLRGH